jgi:hypothetical protein
MKELEEQRVCVKFCCKLGKNFTETFQLYIRGRHVSFGFLVTITYSTYVTHVCMYVPMCVVSIYLAMCVFMLVCIQIHKIYAEPSNNTQRCLQNCLLRLWIAFP